MSKRQKTESKQSTTDWTRLGNNAWGQICSFLDVPNNCKLLGVSKQQLAVHLLPYAWYDEFDTNGWFFDVPARAPSVPAVLFKRGCRLKHLVLPTDDGWHMAKEDKWDFTAWSETLQSVTLSPPDKATRLEALAMDLLRCSQLKSLIVRDGVGTQYFWQYLGQKLVCLHHLSIVCVHGYHTQMDDWPKVAHLVNLRSLDIELRQIYDAEGTNTFDICEYLPEVMPNLHTLKIKGDDKFELEHNAGSFTTKRFPKLTHIALHEMDSLADDSNGLFIEENSKGDMMKQYVTIDLSNNPVCSGCENTRFAVSRRLIFNMPALLYLYLWDTDMTGLDIYRMIVPVLTQRAPNLRLLGLDFSGFTKTKLEDIYVSCAQHANFILFPSTPSDEVKN